MAVSIILEASDEAKEKAKAAGFRERVVLVRFEQICVGANKKLADELTGRVLQELKPYQYLLSDFWGAGPD
jgi:hypothetical protein